MAESNVAQVFPDGTTDYKPLRKAGYDMKKPHITETPITWGNWYKHVNWLNTYFIVGVPILGLIGAYFTPLQTATALFAVFYYFNTGLGITAGTYPQRLRAVAPCWNKRACMTNSIQ